MSVRNEKCVVLKNKRLSSDGYLIVLGSGEISRQTLPGQFVEIGCLGKDMILRRPFSVFDVSDNSISFFIKVIGKGSRWLSELPEGYVVDLIGPLGNGFSLSSGKSLLIGGGCGIASLNLLAERLKQSGGKTDAIFGFSRPEEIPQEVISGFRRKADNVVVTVDSGDYSTLGNVVDRLGEVSLDNYENFYCCGPVRMLKALVPQLSARKTEVSLEARMACGIGVCYGCSINTVFSIKRVCIDGPVFRMEEVIWDEL